MESSFENKKMTFVQKSTVVFVRWAHISIIVFMCFAWLIPNPFWWVFHIFFNPLVVLHWRCNGGKCFLTNIENWVLKRSVPKKERWQFVKSMLRPYTKQVPSDFAITMFIYFILGLACLISLGRLILHKGGI